MYLTCFFLGGKCHSRSTHGEPNMAGRQGRDGGILPSFWWVYGARIQQPQAAFFSVSSRANRHVAYMCKNPDSFAKDPVMMYENPMSESYCKMLIQISEWCLELSWAFWWIQLPSNAAMCRYHLYTMWAPPVIAWIILDYNHHEYYSYKL